MKLTEKYQLVWENDKILVEVESTGNTVTEWTRLNVMGFESADAKVIEDKIVEKKLVPVLYEALVDSLPSEDLKEIEVFK